jgi:hypothetical protein
MLCCNICSSSLSPSPLPQSWATPLCHQHLYLTPQPQSLLLLSVTSTSTLHLSHNLCCSFLSPAPLPYTSATISVAPFRHRHLHLTPLPRFLSSPTLPSISAIFSTALSVTSAAPSVNIASTLHLRCSLRRHHFHCTSLHQSQLLSLSPSITFNFHLRLNVCYSRSPSFTSTLHLCPKLCCSLCHYLSYRTYTSAPISAALSSCHHCFHRTPLPKSLLLYVTIHHIHLKPPHQSLLLLCHHCFHRTPLPQSLLIYVTITFT